VGLAAARHDVGTNILTHAPQHKSNFALPDSSGCQHCWRSIAPSTITPSLQKTVYDRHALPQLQPLRVHAMAFLHAISKLKPLPAVMHYAGYASHMLQCMAAEKPTRCSAALPCCVHAMAVSLSSAAAVAPFLTSPASAAVTVTPPVAAEPCSALRELRASSSTWPTLRAEPAGTRRIKTPHQHDVSVPATLST
jgi:hypothetical protein